MFVFDVTNIINYKEYMGFISSVKSSFDIERKILFDIYNITNSASWNNDSNKYIEFRDKYRILRQDVIREIIKRFRNFLPENCIIYEFGSLTKFTDRIESDVDLTFCYDENKTYTFECAEVLINYSICYVFEHSIDNIHGKFQHYPMIHDYDDLTEEDNLYILKFSHACIEYRCGPEALIENIMGIKNVRDYKSLIDGYKEKYTLECNIDCLYSILVIENSTRYNFIDDLAELENKHNIFLNYKFDFKKYLFGNEVEISELKKAFKETIVSMYIMISFLRKKVNWLDQYSMTMDDVFNSNELILLFGEEYIKNLKNSFVKMIFYWDRIELLLKKNEIRLSTRCHKVFSKKKLNDMLYEKYSEESLVDKALYSINDLNTVVSHGWRVISEK